MKISVILVNYNGFADTCEAVDSLLRQTQTVEIIVVDNASQNDEAALLHQAYPGIRVIRAEKNLGFAGGSNLGIRAALENGADYIMLLNNDTVTSPDMVNLLVRHAAPQTVTVPAMYYSDAPDTLWYGGGFFNRWTGNVQHARLTKPTTVEFATGCCFLVDASVFRRIGLLNERYFMYCEDAEFSLRLKANRIKILYLPGAKLWHKVGRSSGGDDSGFSIYYNAYNRLRLIRSHKSFFRFTALPFAVLSRLARWMQHALRRSPVARYYFKAVVDGLKEHVV